MNPFVVGARCAFADYGKMKSVKMPIGVKAAMKYNKITGLVVCYAFVNFILWSIISLRQFWETASYLILEGFESLHDWLIYR